MAAARKTRFDVVIPSMPGYGFSEKPKSTGWGPDRMGRAFDVLMKRIGYTRYVAQGGDWGSVIADAMGRQAPSGLIGIHVNMPATVPPDVAKALNNGEQAPAGLSAVEKAAFDSLANLYRKGGGYAAMMVTRPQTVGYGLTDSPVGLAAWIYDKFAAWTHSGGEPERVLTKDEMLDDINALLAHQHGDLVGPALLGEQTTTTSTSRSSGPRRSRFRSRSPCPGRDLSRAPELDRARLSPPHLLQRGRQGGHFAQWEQPQLFSAELRSALKSLR